MKLVSYKNWDQCYKYMTQVNDERKSGALKCGYTTWILLTFRSALMTQNRNENTKYANLCKKKNFFLPFIMS